MGETTALGYTPSFICTNNDADLTGIFADKCLQIKFQSVEGGGEADKVEILVDNRNQMVGLQTVGDQSTKLSLALGYVQSGLCDQGTFALDEVDILWPPFSIRFVDTSVGMNNALKAPMVFANEGKTVADIVNGIAQTAEVRAVIDTSIGEKAIPYSINMDRPASYCSG